MYSIKLIEKAKLNAQLPYKGIYQSILTLITHLKANTGKLNTHFVGLSNKLVLI